MFRLNTMSIYRPSKDRKKTIENALKDLDPATRELARIVLENLSREGVLEVSREELYKRIEELKKRKQLKQ